MFIFAQSAFAPSYFIYYLVFGQRFFGVFNVLSMFIILGIGADDIFVFLDTFNQSKAFLHKPTLWERISWTWRRASKAMFVTSLTTMASFLMNTTSSFPAISTFGIFAACLVFVNYMSVILYFPTVVALNESFHRAWNWCCATFFCCLNCHETEEEDDDVEEEEDEDYLEDSTLGPMEHFFKNYYFPFIKFFQIPIVCIFFGIIGMSVWYAKQIVPDPDQPQIFPADDPISGYFTAVSDNFAREG